MSAWVHIFIGWLVFFQLSAHAQRAKVSLKFMKSEVMAVNEEISDLIVKVKNEDSRVADAKIDIMLAEGLELVSKNNFSISLNAGDSVFLPIKVFIGKRARSGIPLELNVRLLDVLNQDVVTASCHIQVGVKKNVLLYTQVSSLLLEQNTDSIKIPVRVLNMGNTAQKISLVVGYPSFVEGGDFQVSRSLSLPASKDTIISFNRRVTKRMFINEGFDVNITGLYANGELFNAAYVKVHIAKTSRNYQLQDEYDSYDNNSLTVGSQGLFGQNEAYLFLGRGNVDLPNGRLNYNLDALVYRDSRFSPTTVRNTNIGYENAMMGMRIGNINKNLDLNLSGRGAEFFLNDTSRNNQYGVGYLSSGSNLLGDRYFPGFSGGKSAWFSFVHSVKRWQWNSDAVYERSPFLNAESFLLNNQLRLKSKHVSYSFLFNTGRSAEYLHGNKIRFGLAAGIDLIGSLKDFNFNSINYLSTGYYPGMRQGALSFSERMTYTKSGGSLWTSLDYYNYRPKRLSAISFFNPEYGSLRVEFGTSAKVFGKVNLSLFPFYNVEKNNSFLFISNGAGAITLESWNIGTTINVPLSADQYCSVNFENGLYKTSIDPRTRFHFKSNANYCYRFFSLNAMFQSGSFYIGEVVSSQAGISAENYIVNITPTVQHKLLRNKLRLEMGMNYSNTRFSGKGLQLTGRSEYELLPKIIWFASLNHNRYTFINGQYQTSILEMGITKKLRDINLKSQEESLQLFLYKDINQNGVYDTSDSVATNALVYVNDVAFVTRGDGTVTYKHLPAAEYLISFPRLKGWYAPDLRIDFKMKQRIEIPLQKTGALKGGISYLFNEFSYEVGQQKEGVLIMAMAENGQVYVTRTNLTGQYVFYLPIGSYQLSINMESLSGEVECIENGMMVMVSDRAVKTMDMVLKVKQRKVETKRFVSPSLKK